MDMTYFNNPYTQQAYGQQFMTNQFAPNGQYGTNVQLGQMGPMGQYGQMGQVGQSGYNVNSQSRVDFQGAIVNSFEDVKVYPVPIGGAVLLLNKTAGKFYLKSLGDNGVPVIESYDFCASAFNSEPEQDKSKESVNDSFSKLEEKIDMLANRMSTYENNLNK